MTSMLRSVLVAALALLAIACGKEPPAPSMGTPVPASVPASASSPRAAPPAVAASAEAPAPGATVAPAEATTESEYEHSLSLAIKPWQGDFDRMLERKLIRVLVPYSRTLYFLDKGRERGITAETVRDFETYINKKYRKDKRPITVIIIPTTRDQLLTNVAAGLGDIAAGNITVTPAREKIVDFYAPDDQKMHDELVVTGPSAPPIATLDDLSGKTVSVRRASSYYDSLVALNRRFAAEKKAPVAFQLLPDALEDPDILEMTNAGVLSIVIVDNFEASVWGQTLPDIEVHEDIAVATGTKIGWAIRKDSPQLADAIADFRNTHLVKQGVTAYRLAQYQKRFRQMTDPTKSEDYARFRATVGLFRKYGPEYGFDPIMLAAQGYQESRLDQGARSHVGAVGVMQIMPATGRELEVGDIRQIEPNVHGGAKYMDKLVTDYFKDAKFDAQNRALFAFASYNAGPGRIQQMRKLATARDLDPDVWFNNVEIVTAEKVGIETTTYVRNIYKYYVSYSLLIAAEEAKRAAREQVKSR